MGQTRKKVRQAGVHYKECEPYSPFQSCAEAGIREMKRAVKRSMVKKGSPTRLWNYCAELQCEIRSNTALDLDVLGGLTPASLIKGNTPEISRLVEHEWYNWVKFRDAVPSFPDTNEVLGRWLGPSPDIGSEMCYHILKETGRVIQCTTVRGLTKAKWESETEETACERFDAVIEEMVGKNASQVILLMMETQKLLTSRHIRTTLTAPSSECLKLTTMMPTHLISILGQRPCYHRGLNALRDCENS
jgi:hypothetical protein